MAIKEVDLAYAAGLFDGEGSVGVCWRVQAKKSTMKTYAVKASVAMIDQPTILWLVATFGGHYDQTCKTKSGNIIHRWTLHARKAADFLELISPYLKLKQDRAEAAIKLARMKRSRGAVHGNEGVRGMTVVEVEAQQPLALFIRQENMRSNPKVQGLITNQIN